MRESVSSIVTKSRTGNLDNRPISPVPRDKHDIKTKAQRAESQKEKKNSIIHPLHIFSILQKKQIIKDDGSTRQVSEFV